MQLKIDTKKIINARNKLGKTQSQVAKELFISQAKYSKIEAGKLKLDLDETEKIAHYYNLTLQEILNDDKILNVIFKDNSAEKSYIAYKPNYKYTF